MNSRDIMISKYCKGLGLEVGGLDSPFSSPESHMLRLDHMSFSELKQRYGKDERRDKIVPFHLIGRNIPYHFIDDNAFDFVVSSHVLEHMPNTGLALKEWVRVIKSGGIVYSIIPDKNKTFDKTRETTPVDVLMEAFDSGTYEAPIEQYIDYYKNVEHVQPDQDRVDDYIYEKYANQESIHVYTFTPETALEFTNKIAPKIGVMVECFFSEKNHNHGNIHIVLRKL